MPWRAAPSAYVHKEDFGPAVVRQIWDDHHSTP